MRKCLAIIGDYWHKADLYRTLLEEMCSAAHLDVDFIEDHREIPWNQLENYTLIILAKEGRIEPEVSDKVWYTEDDGKKIDSWVTKGGGLFVLHSGLASYSRDSLFHSVMQGGFLYHPQEHPRYLVEGRKEAPPEFKDISFYVRDELYVVYVNSSETEILLESSSPDYGTFPAAWRHSQGEGKVFCFTPGHNKEVQADSGYRSIISLGLSWLQ